MRSNVPKLSHVLVTCVLIALSAALLDFVISSHASPRFWDIVLSSIGLALFVGVSGSLVFLFITRWYERKLVPFGSREALLCGGMLLALATGAAASILASNRPERMQADIPVTYAFHCQSKLPPSTLRFESNEVHASYDMMRRILTTFSEANPANGVKVQGLSNVGAVNMNRDSIALLRDLSEYLSLYWLSHPFTTPEFSDVMYRGGGGSRLAVPPVSIRGKRARLADIGGDFPRNSLFGYGSFAEFNEHGVSLPKDMKVRIEHDSFSTSRIVLENDYASITIGIEVAWHRGGSTALLDEKHFGQTWYFGESEYARKIEAERRARYFMGQVVVHFDAEFDRLRYGFPQMRAHEAWARDLLAFLERRFAWGAIQYVTLSNSTQERWFSTSGC